MSTQTTAETPAAGPNQAVGVLLEALSDVHDLAGLRSGVQGSISFWSSYLVPGEPTHRDAADLMAVWTALDAVVAVVEARREGI